MGAGSVGSAPRPANDLWSQGLHFSISNKATDDLTPPWPALPLCLTGVRCLPVQLWEALCMLLPRTSIKCSYAFQSYIPVMDAGSDVTFRWTVDDKPSFTFYNVVFNVIYQSPAVYKLSVSQGLSRETVSILGFHFIPQMRQEKQQGEQKAELN